ncbi:hypothetical protein V8F20_010197 [Naviculisporaceae sp. PSN 640]
MDSLHDDLFGSQVNEDSSPPNNDINTTSRDAPDKYRNILCPKCKALVQPKIKDLCRTCAKKIAAVLAGGHACSSSSNSEASSDYESEPEQEPTPGHLIIGDRIPVSPLTARSLNADIGSPIITSSTSTSSQSQSSGWYTRFSTSTTARTVIFTIEWSLPWFRTRSHSQTHSRTRSVGEYERRRLEREQRAAAEAKTALEREEAAARARFQAWLRGRNERREWQKQIVNNLRIKYPPGTSTIGTTRLDKFLASIKTCPCHDNPDCPVQISLEYHEHVALEDADKTYRRTEGRGIADWVPYLGPRAKRYWVDKEAVYLSSLSCPSDQEEGQDNEEEEWNTVGRGSIKLDFYLLRLVRFQQPFKFTVNERELVPGLWRMRRVLECVWGRMPHARWRGQHSGIGGTIGNKRTVLLRYHANVSRGNRAVGKITPIKGCLLWASERNPCWALVPVLRDGGDVGMVWRWERFVQEPRNWRFFTWVLGKLVRLVNFPLKLVKWAVKWCFVTWLVRYLSRNVTTTYGRD